MKLYVVRSDGDAILSGVQHIIIILYTHTRMRIDRITWELKINNTTFRNVYCVTWSTRQLSHTLHVTQYYCNSA